MGFLSLPNTSNIKPSVGSVMLTARSIANCCADASYGMCVEWRLRRVVEHKRELEDELRRVNLQLEEEINSQRLNNCVDSSIQSRAPPSLDSDDTSP